MKLLKQDTQYKYYQLSEREQDNNFYYDSDVIAVEKEDLKYKTAKDCLLDGDVIPCDYDCYKNPHCVIDEYLIDTDTITLAD